MPERPLALLAFADDRSTAPRILSALEPERRALMQVLEPEQQAGALDVRVSDGGVAHLIRDLQDVRQRLLLFHFSGHGNGQALHLEQAPGQGQTLAAPNLVTLLQDAPRLRLVFLNACATQGQVQALLDAGIPAVIATAHDIGDARARAFSETFYRGLVHGATLAGAFEDARIQLESSRPRPRVFQTLTWEDEDPQTPCPWGLYCPNQADKDWRLADAPHDALRERLRAGTRAYYARETAPGRRLHLAQFEEMLLTEAAPRRGAFDFLPENLIGFEGQQLGRRETVEQLWGRDIRHCLIIGEGGQGKTVSMVKLWEAYLDAPPLPLFIALNDYNERGKRHPEDFLLAYLADRYLGEPTLSEATRAALQQWLRSPWPHPYPKAILLLDGFNEVTRDPSGLLHELQRWRDDFEGRAEGVQFV
ncbi:MAG: CHAT domain-containing protein, partial [Bacteroidetes bacterium]